MLRLRFYDVDKKAVITIKVWGGGATQAPRANGVPKPQAPRAIAGGTHGAQCASRAAMRPCTGARALASCAHAQGATAAQAPRGLSACLTGEAPSVKADLHPDGSNSEDRLHPQTAILRQSLVRLTFPTPRYGSATQVP